jgi:hypothetical protein
MRRGEVRRRGQREGGGLRGGASCGCGGQRVDGRRFGFVTGPAQSPNYKVQSNHDFTMLQSNFTVPSKLLLQFYDQILYTYMFIYFLQDRNIPIGAVPGCQPTSQRRRSSRSG